MDDTLLEFLNFGAGVLCLVCLTCSVIWGLVAQDRMILNIRQRLIAQAVHRVTAVASIAFLLVHIITKLVLEHTSWIAAVVPFGLIFSGADEVTGTAFLIGLGTLAAMLMIFVGITGALRNRFASPAPVAARWRAMHMLAYPAWCAALVHGLFAGRPAKTFFMVSYELCVVAVAAALALRAAPRPVKRQVADRLQAVLGTSESWGRDALEESRARMSETASSSTLPGYESRRPSRDSRPSSYEAVTPPTAPEPANGFAAAYRAVSTPPRADQPFATDQTARMDLSFGIPAAEAVPHGDSGGSTSGNWPIPSPPPVGEAPQSVYDPLQDTGFNIPVYGNPGTGGYGGSDVYDTGETNTRYDAYNPNDTYISGPADEPPPGASFDAPGSGEPWNTPSGGYR
ncbi:ferric reductase-like transmembrane domain-containing protein [Streptomyces bobili]|uniref:ferric reductase-like transmembrane domain-containing protein n=1 Tax=Streptomyces bobili TaxID=67280 RepID=UPI0033A16CEC